MKKDIYVHFKEAAEEESLTDLHAFQITLPQFTTYTSNITTGALKMKMEITNKNKVFAREWESEPEHKYLMQAQYGHFSGQ